MSYEEWLCACVNVMCCPKQQDIPAPSVSLLLTAQMLVSVNSGNNEMLSFAAISGSMLAVVLR